MKQTIEDYIRQNEYFRQALLKQEGGIMKYWAEHPDAEFDYKLYDGYEQQIVEAYKRAHCRSREVARLSENELKVKARNWYHLTEKEMHYQAALQPILKNVPDEIKEQVNRYIDDYLVDADKDYLRCLYPDGMPPAELYKGLITDFGQGHYAFNSLMHMFREHYTQGEWVRCERERLDEFFYWRRVAATYEYGGFKALRQAVEEMLRGKTDEECRQIAIAEMNKVRLFSRVINDDDAEIRLGDHKVTDADREWLRGVVRHYPLLILSNHKVSRLHSSFATYVNLLRDIGQIWAARLLRCHHTDMRELENETGAILFSTWGTDTEVDNRYYVDRDEGDTSADCCVYDEEQAEMLLSNLHKIGNRERLADAGRENVIAEKITDIANKLEEQNDIIRRIEHHSNVAHHQQRRLDSWESIMRYVDVSSFSKQEGGVIEGPPKELCTEEAQLYWTKLREKGFVVEGGYTLAKGISPYDATYIAELFSEKLKIKHPWKVFQSLWSMKNMAQYKNDYANKQVRRPHKNEIEEIFGIIPKN